MTEAYGLYLDHLDLGYLYLIQQPPATSGTWALKNGQSKLRCTVTIKYILSFDDNKKERYELIFKFWFHVEIILWTYWAN